MNFLHQGCWPCIAFSVLQLNSEDDAAESGSKDLVLSNDNVAFSPDPAPYSKFPSMVQTSTMIREGVQFKPNQRKMTQRKRSSAFRNLMSVKSVDQPDNSIQEFCVTNEELAPSRGSQKFSVTGTSSSSESSPSSTSLRQRISTLENLGRNALMKPKLILNRRWGGNKNGESSFSRWYSDFSVL